jgi:GNAT superfamily N-acetyltransferase
MPDGPTIRTQLGCEHLDWDQVIDLYAEVGLVAGHGKKRDAPAIRAAFSASTRVVSAWSAQQLVGAARLLSDGVCYGTIFDVGVRASWQRRGVGRRLIATLTHGLGHLCLHLTSTFGNEPFYASLGFRRHRTAMARYPEPSAYLEEPAAPMGT